MIRRFDIQKDGALLSRWLDAYRLAPLTEEVLRGVGIVVDDVAMAFLFHDPVSRRGYLDNFIANPMADKTERDIGVRAVTRVLTAHAEMLGIRLLTVLANIPTMRRRFQELGFCHHADFGLYYKELGG